MNVTTHGRGTVTLRLRRRNIDCGTMRVPGVYRRDRGDHVNVGVIRVVVWIVGPRQCFGCATVGHLWRAVDQDGDVIDILVQRYRNAHAAKRFFRKLLKGQGSTPWKLVTDKLKSYGAAHRMTMPCVDHNTVRYEDNRAEVSHQPTRQRERLMRGFKSAGQAQRFLSVQGVILNFFRFARHQMRTESYPLLRARSFKEWSVATGA